MLLGILSDTHDRVDAAVAAVNTLRQAGAQHLIHCGDVGGERILDLFAGIPTTLVWGNNDYDHVALAQYAAHLNIQCFDDMAEMLVDGKRIAITHGDSSTILKKVLHSGQFDYLLHGHTHRASDTHEGKLRVINPGALYRTDRKSVAVLDPASDKLRQIFVTGC